MKKLFFRIFPRMSNTLRVAIFIFLFICGISLQLETREFWSGAILIFCSSLLMINKGVDSRLHVERYRHNAEWKPTNRQQIEDIIKMDKKLRRWDRSGYEVSSTWGVILFIVVIIVGFCFIGNVNDDNMSFFGGDFLILFIPHFLTGFKKFDKISRTLFYTKHCLKAADIAAEINKDIKIEFLTLLIENNKTKALYPKEVKLKMTLDGSPESFLGCYGQISINSVKGTDYPYFYTVIVFKPEFKLNQKFNNITLQNKGMLKEYTVEKDVQVLVLRQVTTRTTGYFTTNKAVRGILAQTFETYRQLMTM